MGKLGWFADKLIVAKRDGRAACRDGKKRDENPYWSGDLSTAWDAGWASVKRTKPVKIPEQPKLMVCVSRCAEKVATATVPFDLLGVDATDGPSLILHISQAHILRDALTAMIKAVSKPGDPL